MLEDVISELSGKLEKTIEAFKRDLSRIRTGRANLAILEPIRVSYYGSMTPLNQIASISVQDARLIVIKPWDKSIMGEIEKAINISEIGLTPQNDGELVRLPIPALTEERRKELVKQTKKLAENARIASRNQRRDSNDFLKELEKSSEISEDEKKRGLDRVQKETDRAIAKIDEVLIAKEKEIMEI